VDAHITHICLVANNALNGRKVGISWTLG